MQPYLLGERKRKGRRKMARCPSVHYLRESLLPVLVLRPDERKGVPSSFGRLRAKPTSRSRMEEGQRVSNQKGPNCPVRERRRADASSQILSGA